MLCWYSLRLVALSAMNATNTMLAGTMIVVKRGFIANTKLLSPNNEDSTFNNKTEKVVLHKIPSPILISIIIIILRRYCLPISAREKPKNR